MNHFEIGVQRVFPLLALVACSLLSIATAEANSPSSREADALVQSVDRKSTIATIQIEGDSRLRSFEWNQRTRFVHHGKFTGSEVLAAGAAVRIRYRVPFFGKPFLSKVTSLERVRSSTKPQHHQYRETKI